MHMADALVSPAVGGVMFAASAAAVGFAVRKTAEEQDEKKIPVMGVLGAFVFAAQMINFTIPGTGSSGHIGGGVLLAALLGPYPALLTLAAVLLIQCLFFADGGLLAYGCNVFNMGVASCLLAWRFVYQPLAGGAQSRRRVALASVAAVIAGLQLGAFCVTLETVLSGVTELPFGVFVLLMQPIHLAIGLVEGLVTAAVLCYVQSVQPELLRSAAANAAIPRGVSLRRALVSFAVLAAVTGGVLSIFASSHPDGLEWSVEKTAGAAEIEREGPAYDAASSVVEKSAFMPGYGFPGGGDGSPWGTAAAGIAGSVLTVLLAGGAGMLIKRLRKPRGQAA
ncbi:MAG: cobalamin (vitamin B12) biosynthesis CbiM protein [Treponematales bacterium]